MAQVLSSCQLIDSTPLFGGAYGYSFDVHSYMHILGMTESCSVYVFIMLVEARRYAVWVIWSHEVAIMDICIYILF